MPETVVDLDRVIPLVGSRSVGQELSKALQELLERELGAYPSPKLAGTWKHHLKRRRRALIEAG